MSCTSFFEDPHAKKTLVTSPKISSTIKLMLERNVLTVVIMVIRARAIIYIKFFSLCFFYYKMSLLSIQSAIWHWWNRPTGTHSPIINHQGFGTKSHVSLTWSAVTFLPGILPINFLENWRGTWNYMRTKIMTGKSWITKPYDFQILYTHTVLVIIIEALSHLWWIIIFPGL